MDEPDYLLKLRQARTDRLKALSIKRATLGRNLPAEDLVEIESIKKELGMTELAISNPTRTAFADELGSAGQFQVVTQILDQLRDYIRDGLDHLGDRITIVEVESHEWRHTEREDRQNGHRWTMYIIVIHTIVLSIVVMALIALLLKVF